MGRAINPTLVEGQIEGGAMMGLGLALLEASYPYYPSNEHRGGDFGSYLAPALADMPEIESMIVENPSVDGPFGAKAIGEMANNAQAPAICAAIYDASASGSPSSRRRPERVLRALEAKRAGNGRAAPRGQAGHLRRAPSRVDDRRARLAHHADGRHPMSADAQASLAVPLLERRRAHEFVPGVHIKAAGGEQVCVCDVKYDGRQAGAAAHARAHRAGHGHHRGRVHGDGRGRALHLRAGRRGVINRGREHSVYSEHGVRFFEALAPVPLDHIPDKQRDLVLGPDGGSGHVER